MSSTSPAVVDAAADAAPRAPAPGRARPARPARCGAAPRSRAAPRSARWRPAWRRSRAARTAASRPPRAARSSAGRMSRAPPIVACACSSRRRAASSVCSWRSATCAASAERHRPLARQLAGRRECRQPGQLLHDRGELERAQRAGIGGGATADRRSATGDVRVVLDPQRASARPPTHPRSRRRSAGRYAASATGRTAARAAPGRRAGPRRSCRRSIPERCPDVPRPRRQAQRPRHGRRDARAPASTPSSIASARMRTASGFSPGPAHDVEAVMEAVDEVDVEVARRPEHHLALRAVGGRREEWAARSSGPAYASTSTIRPPTVPSRRGMERRAPSRSARRDARDGRTTRARAAAPPASAAGAIDHGKRRRAMSSGTNGRARKPAVGMTVSRRKPTMSESFSAS